ncbi:hypothetical protein RDV84_08365 [Lysobacter yananisis]|uniref:HEAT repeat domain-containing protein n=1 Tax=Lysobacter yananisis TaxID=1003114 RepID=A0ABY9PFK3_9GAMM|nr:hypothetical protein [Lysobacter yananisis]WMT04840.1 hypothetical protein RDV84_08365 [Lysobacter yananisis]
MQGTPGPAAARARTEPPRSNAPTWTALALPPLACALWLAWAAYRVGNAEADTGLAYDTVLQGIVGAAVAAVVALAVLLWAGRRGHAGHALLALIAGTALSPLLLWFGLGAVLSSRRHDFERRQQQVQALSATIRGGDAARIRAAIDALPDNPGPARTLCMLQGRESYRLVKWLWVDEHGYGPNLPSDELLAAAAAVVGGPASAQDKQASLRVVLRALADRNEPQRLGEWVALWRRTLPQPAPQPLPLSAPAEEYGDCTLGDPAERVLREWGDDGVRAWLDAGLGFEPGRGQAIVALRAVRSTDTLRALLAADPRFAELLRSDRDAGEDALSAQADSLSAALDASSQPSQQAELVEALRAAGARPREIGPVTSCELFDNSEQRRAQPHDPPARQAAARRIRAVLCPGAADAPTPKPRKPAAA